MTHFELFDIPLSFFPDQKIIRAKYYALSRLYHPDLQDDNDGISESERIQKTSELNEAYRVLGSFDKLVPYILRLEGELNEEEKATVSPAFLMEMMDVNESLMEAKMESDADRLQSIAHEVNEIQEEVMEAWKKSCEAFDTSHTKGLLAEIKDYYLRNKYLERLKDQLSD